MAVGIVARIATIILNFKKRDNIMKVNIINIVGKWLDLSNKADSIANEKVAQAKLLDDHEPMLKNCSTFGGVKTRFEDIHKQLYLGFITKYIQDKNIKLKNVKIADKVYNFTVEDCLLSMTELKKEYNPDVANYFRSSKSPLGFMRNLDTHVKEKWADFRADLQTAGNPVEEVVTEVDDTPKITLKPLEQVAKALAQQYKTLGNKAGKDISKQDVIQPKEELKALAEKNLERENSKYTFKDILKML